MKDQKKPNKKLEKYKIYKKIFEASSQIECVHCEETISANAFKTHMKKCPRSEESFATQSLPPIKVEISHSNTFIDEVDCYRYREYELSIEYRETNYRIKRGLILFLTLYDNLEDHFPSLRMPKVPEVFETHPDDRKYLKEEGVYAEDITGPLQVLMQFF